MADIVALGEILIDFMQTAVSDDGYPTIKAQPGGAPANFFGGTDKMRQLLRHDRQGG